MSCFAGQFLERLFASSREVSSVCRSQGIERANFPSELPVLTYYFSPTTIQDFKDLQDCIVFARNYALTLQLKPYVAATDALASGAPSVLYFNELTGYAASNEKLEEFCFFFAELVLAKGSLEFGHQELQEILESSGLDWNFAQYLLGNDAWLEAAESNASMLAQAELALRPVFQFGQRYFDGQDAMSDLECAVKTEIQTQPS